MKIALFLLLLAWFQLEHAEPETDSGVVSSAMKIRHRSRKKLNALGTRVSPGQSSTQVAKTTSGAGGGTAGERIHAIGGGAIGGAIGTAQLGLDGASLVKDLTADSGAQAGVDADNQPVAVDSALCPTATTPEEDLCFWTNCHSHHFGSGCPVGMRTKRWESCRGIFGKREECCIPRLEPEK